MVAHTKCFAELTTPSAPVKGGFAAFLDGASTPPFQGGEYAFPNSSISRPHIFVYRQGGKSGSDW